jgi:hypothetical protein
VLVVDPAVAMSEEQRREDLMKWNTPVPSNSRAGSPMCGEGGGGRD